MTIGVKLEKGITVLLCEKNSIPSNLTVPANKKLSRELVEPESLGREFTVDNETISLTMREAHGSRVLFIEAGPKSQGGRVSNVIYDARIQAGETNTSIRGIVIQGS